MNANPLKTDLKKKKRGYSTFLDSNLPKTKTVWGLNKEEIEFCAYLFQALALLILFIDLIYVGLGLRAKFGSTGNTSQITIPLLLLILSLIPSGFGFYGVIYENKISLIVFISLDVFSLFIYLFVVINWTFLLIGKCQKCQSCGQCPQSLILIKFVSDFNFRDDFHRNNTFNTIDTFGYICNEFDIS